MKKVTAIRHVAFEDLGSFAGVLTDNGFEIRYSTHRPLKQLAMGNGLAVASSCFRRMKRSTSVHKPHGG